MNTTIMDTNEKSNIELSDPLIDSVTGWLISQALKDTPIELIFKDTCIQLYAAGIPVSRAHVTFRVLHPLFQAQSLTWKQNQEVKEANYLHGSDMTPWYSSPLYFMVSNKLTSMRRHLVGDDAILDFDVLKELSQAGGTDYLAYLIPFNESAVVANSDNSEQGDGIVGSWSTDRENGFTNSDIRSLKRVEQRLAVAFKINIQSRITTNILAAYLGPGAGKRVLDGQIKRGDGETIRAVIWYSDLRDSTRLADSISGQAFLQVLNSYFESTAGAVLQHGGEVLRFIGDAVLAIFPLRNEKDIIPACESAMQAAFTAQISMDAVNSERLKNQEECLDFGLGLHVGEVLFGNIGVPERVEFSVIGPAANEVARLEALTKKLNHRVLVSEDFARHMSLDWIDVGAHALKGVGKALSVFAPPPGN